MADPTPSPDPVPDLVQAKPKMGRPAIDPADWTDTICFQIASGSSLAKICSQEGYPSVETVRKWIIQCPDFFADYTRARSAQADTYADQIVEISDLDQDPNKSRVQIDARKWVTAKLLPKKYGEPQQMGVVINNNVAVMVSEEKRAELIARRQALLQSGSGPVIAIDSTSS